MVRKLGASVLTLVDIGQTQQGRRDEWLGLGRACNARGLKWAHAGRDWLQHCPSNVRNRAACDKEARHVPRNTSGGLATLPYAGCDVTFASGTHVSLHVESAWTSRTERWCNMRCHRRRATRARSCRCAELTQKVQGSLRIAKVAPRMAPTKRCHAHVDGPDRHSCKTARL